MKAVNILCIGNQKQSISNKNSKEQMETVTPETKVCVVHLLNLWPNWDFRKDIQLKTHNKSCKEFFLLSHWLIDKMKWSQISLLF